ncbi:MAG: radical SAM protein [Clostridia bacterium]|nr:radical SAM protein [Clostridia bacterium]
MRIALVMIDPMVGKTRHRAGGAVYSLAAYVKEKNPYRDHIEIQNFNFNSLYPGAANINISAIASFKPDVIGFSTYCWNFEQVKSYVRGLKAILKDITIVLGGPEVSYGTEAVMEELKEVDIVIRGEGEITFNEVVSDLFLGHKGLQNIKGITYRKGNGEITSNEDRPLHPVLDDFPSPLLTGMIDLSKCDGEVAFETVRGCRFKCSYCLYTKGMNCVRYFSLERVEKELEIVLLSPYVKIIWFVDPTFNENEERALQILKIIEKYNPSMPLAFELRADCLTEPLIEQLRRLNVAEVAIGIQSSSEEVNKHVQRKNNLEVIHEKIFKLRKAISNTCGEFDMDLIYGLPGDVYENYKKSVDYILSLGGRIFYQALRVFKGTELYESADQFGIVYNKTPPYNVISSSSYDLQQMVLSYCLNAGIDFYNRGGIYKKIIEKIVESRNINYSDLFEEIGKYFWDLQEIHMLRISNWAPDDRDEEDVRRDFTRTVVNYLKGETDAYLKNEISLILGTKEDERTEDGFIDSIKAAYFYQAI